MRIMATLVAAACAAGLLLGGCSGKSEEERQADQAQQEQMEQSINQLKEMIDKKKAERGG